MSSDNKTVSIRKPLNINIGFVFFLVIFVYIIICVIIYFSTKHITGYEVNEGSLSVPNKYLGIALRDEVIVDSGAAGYVNYFATEGEKVGYNNLVCCVDETGALQDYIAKNEDEGNGTLTEKDFFELKNEMINFTSAFNQKNYIDVYDFKNSLQGDVLKYSNRRVLGSLDEIRATSSLLKMINAPSSGVIMYTIDGFEREIPGNISREWFDREAYENNKKQLVNNTIVSVGDPLYKQTNDENWSVMIEVEPERYDEYIEEGYIKVKFYKNQYESWGKVTGIQGKDDGKYIKLDFTNSMISFAGDRFIELQLLVDAETGLKIPNSAIAEKEFFLIPWECITAGGENGGKGVMVQKYNENGEMDIEFVPTTIYSRRTEAEIQGIDLKEDNPNYEALSKEYAYVDDSVLQSNNVLLITDSSENFTIGRIGSLKGVYNINKGYADFKVVKELNSNEEYCIVESNTEYGLLPHDYIALDASSVDNDDFVYE